MNNVDDILEPAIPPHLRRDRTRPLGTSSNFKPKHPSYSARFDQSVTHLPMVYLGIQSPPGTEVEPALHAIKAGIAAPFGPETHDQARFVDDQGFVNIVFALYWRGRAEYQRWRNNREENWWYAGLSLGGDVGAFEEAYVPSVMDTETTFSHPYPEGYSKLADNMSGATDTHEYWGSARDRVPRSQIEGLAPRGMLGSDSQNMPDDTRGRWIRIHPAENLCLLRSGQDWSMTEGEERAFYLDIVHPTLLAGMNEIGGDTGIKLGCCFNRFMRMEDEAGPIEKSYSLSAWNSLADLEAWVKTDTHLKIFAAGIRHYQSAGDSARLRLYHEMMVLRSEDQSMTYFNCHSKTGLLRALAARR